MLFYHREVSGHYLLLNPQDLSFTGFVWQDQSPVDFQVELSRIGGPPGDHLLIQIDLTGPLVLFADSADEHEVRVSDPLGPSQRKNAITINNLTLQTGLHHHTPIKSI